MRVVPLVRGEPGDYEHGDGDEHVGGKHIQPDLDGQRVHEGEESGLLTCWYLRVCVRETGRREDEKG